MRSNTPPVRVSRGLMQGSREVLSRYDLKSW